MEQKSCQIRENYQRVKENIAQACRQAGRRESEVRLMTVSKTQTLEAIAEAVAAGADLFGENRVQELRQKADFFREHGVECHLIGQLQTNKVKYLPELTDTVQSVDGEKLAAEIDRQYAKQGKTARVLIEVNIGGEESKSGVTQTEILSLAEKIAGMEHLRLEGLMCVPPICGEDEVRRYFARMREWFQRLREEKLPGASIEVLSMGMTDDYVQAVLEGSTLVRVGSGIFGPRSYPVR